MNATSTLAKAALALAVATGGTALHAQDTGVPGEPIEDTADTSGDL